MQIHVSPSVSDTGDGSVNNPYGTIGQAWQRVRQLRQEHPDRPVTVLLRGGVYRFTETLKLGPLDSGSAHAPVVWKAAPGQFPVFAGSVRVNHWRPCQDVPPGTKAPLLEADLSGLVNPGKPVNCFRLPSSRGIEPES